MIRNTTLDRAGVFMKPSFKFLKRLGSTLNTAALLSRKESVHKIDRQEVEGFTHLFEIHISSVKNEDLVQEEILNSFTLLSWYMHRNWKSLVGHIFPAANLISITYSQLISKLPETQHYISDSNWFPQNFVNIAELILEIIQKLTIKHNNIEIKNYNEENQTLHVQTSQRTQLPLWKHHR